MGLARPKPTLSGVIVPMITPFTNTGDFDFETISKLVDFYLASGVNGLFLLGGSGEGPWLTIKQQRTLVEYVARVVGGRVPILTGALETSTNRVLEVIHMLEDAGADVLVVTTPYYFGSDAAVHILHIETIAAATKLPIMLYNIPATTHNVFAAETVRQLIDVDNLVGLKDSSWNMEEFIKMIALKSIRDDFYVLQGIETLALPSLQAGADGVLPGLSNVIPGLFRQLIDLFRRDDIVEAEKIQARITGVYQLYKSGFWIECLKHAVSILGYGEVVMCSRPNLLTESEKQGIYEILSIYADHGRS